MAPMVRVLHILSDLGPGGGERMPVHLMRTLNRRRFEVRAVSLYDEARPVGSDLKELLAQDEVPVWNLGKRPGFDPRMFTRIGGALRRFRPDVVHTHLQTLRYALLPMLYRGVPAMVHTVHNLAEREVDRPSIWLHRLAFRRGVVPVAIGQEVAASISRVYGIRGFPSINYGIPVEVYGRPREAREVWRRRQGFAPEDTIFVCVAQFRPQKNHRLLLEAFAKGAAAHPRVHLLLVGWGSQETQLRKQVEALGLRRRVHFMGLRTDIPEVLAASDVFVLSSDWEGNPLAVMEAMSAGKPVISTSVGGVPELIKNGSSGLLVPQANSEAFARAVNRLATNPQMRKAMGTVAAKCATERFSVETMTEAYEELYEAMLAGNLSFTRGRRPS
jgi:glycosyltransferase involved in cell wall biosynthesis